MVLNNAGANCTVCKHTSVPKAGTHTPTTTTTNCRSMPKQAELIKAGDLMFETVFQRGERSWGGAAGTDQRVIESKGHVRAYKDQRMMRGGEGERNVRERLLELDCRPTEQGARSQGAILFRRPSVHRET